MEKEWLRFGERQGSTAACAQDEGVEIADVFGEKGVLAIWDQETLGKS